MCRKKTVRRGGVSSIRRELHQAASRIASRRGVSVGRVVAAYRVAAARGCDSAISARDLFINDIGGGAAW